MYRIDNHNDHQPDSLIMPQGTLEISQITGDTDLDRRGVQQSRHEEKSVSGERRPESCGDRVFMGMRAWKEEEGRREVWLC